MTNVFAVVAVIAGALLIVAAHYALSIVGFIGGIMLLRFIAEHIGLILVVGGFIVAGYYFTNK